MEIIQIQSFPRSGSNYFITLLQYLYRSRVEDWGGSIAYNKKTPFYPIENSDILLAKSHVLHYPEKTDKLIMLIRDPKECLVRHCEFDIKHNLARGTKFNCTRRDKYIGEYISMIDDYDKFSKPKMIVYYKDLIKQPKIVLESIINFIETPPTKTISELLVDKVMLAKKTANLHKYVNLSDTTNIELIRHQKGMPQEDYDYYKKRLGDINILTHFFNNGAYKV